MNKNEFIKIMAYLGNAYGKEITQEMLKVWYSFFKDTDLEIFKNAVYQVITSERFFPSIAIINETIVKQTTPSLSLSGEEEWEKVLDAIHKYGWREDEALNSLEPVTRNIVKRLGYEHICMADANLIYNYRSSFLKAFENEQRDIKTYEMLNAKLPQSVQIENIKNRAIIENVINNLLEDKKM